MKLKSKIFNGIEYTLVDFYKWKEKEIITHFAGDEIVVYFDRPTIKKWLEKKQNIECITNMEEFEKFMTPDPWRYRNRR